MAAFLADAGRTVRLYESDTIAAGASGRNSGIVQHPFDPVLADLYRRTLAEYRLLADASDGTFRIESEPAGLLYVGHDPALAERTARDWTAAWPTTMAEVLVGPALARARAGARARSRRLPPGHRLSGRSRGRNRGVCRSRSTTRSGVRDRRLGAARARGLPRRRRPRRRRARSPRRLVVVAGGPWTPSIVDPSGAWRPIRPSWGVVASVALDGAPRHGLEAIDIAIEPADAEPPPSGPIGGADARAATPTSSSASCPPPDRAPSARRSCPRSRIPARGSLPCAGWGAATCRAWPMPRCSVCGAVPGR